ncbi:Por secretion system C-terminal sorting domain-containing protein [Polaribacter sp. KT25b]|uniref:T9SS type A sorting domain-containing protein n=1 Tax=Polaribacter sp. KT25b TaxID=1855336 RepID=UPI00087A8224|nr:T9SS type A sorting domain-containing protein [Polaribacter sp. KT25b]SDR70582.1 Por secretion system C-terminal sorting domain-containing protein [Polaribacter sp. KT25b]
MIKKNIILIFCLFLSGFIFSQNPIDRVLPADSYFYNPTINTANQLSFPNGDNSTSALQNMINSLSASGGGILTINAGTYTLGQLDMRTGVHIRVNPNVVFKTTPQGALFQAGFDNNFANANNWSFQSTNGEKFTFDFSDFEPNTNIRAFQLGNTNNFKLADFIILDNYTKFNAISAGAVGDASEPALFTKFGIIENLDTKNAHYGYGLIQFQVGQDILFRNLSGEGGVTLRLESGYSGLADLYVTDKTPIINNVYGRNISCTNGAHAVMLSPHTITQGIVDVRDITGISCEAAVSINFGFLSADKGQTTPDHSEGTFSEDSVIANVFATYGTDAQVRSARLRHIPCALRNYISAEKNLDDESYKAPSLAPVYYLALEDYVSKNSPAGSYKIVLENVTHSGFSDEVRADGLITDGGENDFEGCDINESPIWIKGDDKNTPNPLQTTYTALSLSVTNFIDTNDIVIYQEENTKELIIKSNLKANIKIYNLIGQLLKNVSKLETKISINLSDIPKNIYIIHLESDKKIITKKIIIN